MGACTSAPTPTPTPTPSAPTTPYPPPSPPSPGVDVYQTLDDFGANVSDSDEEPLVRETRENAVNWHARYLAALSLPVEKLGRAEMVNNTFRDFSAACKTYAHVLVSELSMVSRLRTIPPDESLGGVAGGTKAIVQGILFKIPEDPPLHVNSTNERPALVHLYSRAAQPSWELAAKAAGHDLNGANAVLAAADALGLPLRVPLQVIVDFEGFRVLAMPLLPLGKDSLQYGSSDGGRTLPMSDAAINEYMQQVGELLHLAPHHVAGQLVFTAGDVEVHRGTDGEAHVLDFGRTFPPEAPGMAEHLPPLQCSILVRLLRPELLQRWRVERNGPPLNPDAFSRWNQHEPNAREHHEHVRQATRFLLEEVVPELAARLSVAVVDADLDVWLDGQLVETTHRAGVNMRHLGLVRSHVEGEGVAVLLLVECVKRALKNLLRNDLRQVVLDRQQEEEEEAAYGQQVAVLRTAVEFVQLMSGGHVRSAEFYAQRAHPATTSRFGHVALDGVPAEALAAVLRPHVFHLISYVLHACGLQLSPAYLADLRQRGSSLSDAIREAQPTSVDIQTGTPKVKSMRVLAAAEGRALLAEAAARATGLHCTGGGHDSSQLRLVALALARFAAGGSASALSESDRDAFVVVAKDLVSRASTHGALLEWLQQPVLRAAVPTVEAILRMLLDSWQARRAQGGIDAAFGGPAQLQHTAQALEIVAALPEVGDDVLEQLRVIAEVQIEALVPLQLAVVQAAEPELHVLDGSVRVTERLVSNSGRSTVAAPSLSAAAGAWYYEAEYLSPGYVRMGWATDQWTGGSFRFVGGGVHSWSLCPPENCINHFRQRAKFGNVQCKPGDVVGSGVQLDKDAGVLRFSWFVNGVEVDAHFEAPVQEVFPAVTLYDDLQQVRVAFHRRHLRFLPDGFEAAGEVVCWSPVQRGVRTPEVEVVDRERAMDLLPDGCAADEATTWCLRRVALSAGEVRAGHVDSVVVVQSAPSIDTARLWLRVLAHGEQERVVLARGLAGATGRGDASSLWLWLQLGADPEAMTARQRPLGMALLGRTPVDEINWEDWDLGPERGGVWRTLLRVASPETVHPAVRLALDRRLHVHECCSPATVTAIAGALSVVEAGVSGVFERLDVDEVARHALACVVGEHSLVLPPVVAYLVQGGDVRCLDAAGGYVGDVTAATLASRMTGLVEVNLSHGSIRDGKEIAHAVQQAVRLEVLDLSHNEIGEDGAAMLAAVVERHPTLRSVAVAHCGLGVRATNALAAALRRNVNGLVRLDVGGNEVVVEAFVRACEGGPVELGLSEVGLQSLEGWESVTQLVALDVSGNGLVDDGEVAALVRSNAGLKCLDVRRNKLRGTEELAAAVKEHEALREVLVGGNEGVDAVPLVRALVGHPTVQRVDVSGGGEWFLKLVEGSSVLESLDLGGLAELDLAGLGEALAANRTLVSLSLRANGMRDVSPLAGKLHVRELDVSENLLTSVAEIVAGSEGLECLNAVGNPLASVDGVVDAIKACGSLKRLQLGRSWAFVLATELGDDATAEGLLGVRSDAVELVLDGEVPVDLATLGAAVRSSQCRVLGLSRCELGDVSALGGLAGVEVLDLSWNGLHEVAELLASDWPSLRRLDLSHNELVDVGAVVGMVGRLESVSLVGNPVKRGLVELGEALRGVDGRVEMDDTPLRILSLFLSDEPLKCAEVLGITPTPTLQLARKQLGDELAVALGRGLRYATGTTELVLNDNGIGVEGARAIGAGLAHCPGVTHLMVYRNPLGSEGASAVVRGAQDCRGLVALNAGSCGLDDAVCADVAELLQRTPRLVELVLSRNEAVTGVGARQVVRAARDGCPRMLKLGLKGMGLKGALGDGVGFVEV